MSHQQSLADTVAFVTGGGRGLGLDIAHELASKGVHVFITGRTRETLEPAAGSCRAMGVKSAFAEVDVTDQAGMTEAVNQCESLLGPIDLLINNAGIGAHGPIADCDVDEWWRVMEVNVKGPLISCRAVLPGMLARGSGRIINMGSYQAFLPAPIVSSYATSKAALMRMTDSMAEEAVEHGVIVLALSPGFVRTDMGLHAEQVMKAMVPDFEGFPSEFTFESDAIAKLICRVAAGEADAFHGRMLHVRNDLDGLIAETDTILRENRFAMVFND
ncbi:MAG: SDR family oxidoreductase [Pseudomonadota bacterium]